MPQETSWLDVSKRDWNDALLSRSHLTRDNMPTLIEGNSISGHIRKELAVEFGLPHGVKIAGGGGDNAASAIGMGVINAGDAFLSIGTSGVLFAANTEFSPQAETAVHSFCHALPDKWHQMGVILAATDALNWYATLVSKTAENLTSNLGALQPPSKTLFFPYLGGERTPLNNATIRGAFFRA